MTYLQTLVKVEVMVQQRQIVPRQVRPSKDHDRQVTILESFKSI